MQDPKTSRWLWDIRERSRQKRRTEHFRDIMKFQKTLADPLAQVSEEDDSAETKENLEMLTRLREEEQLGNYLSYGKWDLKEKDIERLQKDDEMRQRVSIESLTYTFHNNCFLHRKSIIKWHIYFSIFTYIICVDLTHLSFNFYSIKKD